jgi:hypothetical protein
MLAYVFWHWRRADISSAVYDRTQQRFHRALADAPPTGFLRSRCTDISAVPWVPAARDAREDWYLVENFAALDALAEAAVSASRQQPHDSAAAMAEGGTAGLYRLRGSGADLVPSRAWWFAKPAGMSYAAFDALMAPVLARGDTALWGRQLTLGPTPEFCLQADAPVTLPTSLEPLTTALRPIWP